MGVGNERDGEDIEQPAEEEDIFRTINFDEDDQGATEPSRQLPQNSASLQDVPSEFTGAPPPDLREERVRPGGLADATPYRVDLRRIDLTGNRSNSCQKGYLSTGRSSLERTQSRNESSEILEMDNGTNKPKARKRRPRFHGLSAAELLPSVSGLLKRMEQAAINDIKSHDRGEPAFEKLKMLDEVEEACIHRDKQPLLLNEGLLGVLKSWIEPLSDGILPNIKIRTTVLRILLKLPIDTADGTDRTNLKMSKIGSRVMFLSRINDETRENRRMANELVQRWTRPIFEEARRYDNEERIQDALLARRRRAAAEKKEAEKRKGLKPGHPDFRYSVLRPQPERDYVIKPDGRVDPTAIQPTPKTNTVIQKINNFRRRSQRR